MRPEYPVEITCLSEKVSQQSYWRSKKNMLIDSPLEDLHSHPSELERERFLPIGSDLRKVLLNAV